MNTRRNFATKFQLIFGLVMAFIYIGAGLFLILSRDSNKFAGYHPDLLGAMLIAYGVYRFWNMRQKEKRREENQSSNE